MLKISVTRQFMKDLKIAKRRGLDIEILNEVVRLISEEQPLPVKNKDHKLTGNYAGYRECHIQPDWLLIYSIDSRVSILNLIRTGTHSDLF